MSPAPRHLTYQTGGKAQQLLTLGPDGAAQRILIVPLLFDEMNRMRHTLVEAMRALAMRGIAAALPDLPGCNESLCKLEEQSLESWRAALSGANDAFAATHIFSIRGGCLIDNFDPALPVMRLAPVKGKSLLNMMIRTRIAGDKESGVTTSSQMLEDSAKESAVELGGNMIGPAMWAQLIAAEASDRPDALEIKPADAQGSALWLRAEPQHSAEMADGLASMLADWSTQI